MISFLKEFQKTSDCGEDLVAITVWHIMMGSVEWTRKADFLDKEALRHIKQNCKLLGSFSKQAKTQLALLVTIQSYCYENMDFMKVCGWRCLFSPGCFVALLWVYAHSWQRCIR